MNQGHLRRITLGLLLCVLATSINAATVSVELSPTQPVANEKAPLTPAVVLIKRGLGDPVTSDLEVTFSLDGTAVLDVDYALGLSTTVALGSSSQITIPAGQSSVSLFINPLADVLAEGQETVVVQLLGGTGYNVGLPNSVQAPIADDDVAVSLFTPLPLAYEDYTTGPGSVLDPDSNRRGVFRVSLTPARSFSTYVLTELSAGGVAGAAQLTSDYSVVYKIGGGSMGQGIGYTVQPRSVLAGASQITVTGGSGGIPIGSKIVFSGSSTEYTSTTAVTGASGTFFITPVLTDALINGSTVTVTPTLPTGFRVNNADGYTAGTSSIAVDNGSGNIPAGAVITIGANSYTAPTGLLGTNGALTLSPALLADVIDNDPITVTWPTISGYTTTGGTSEPIGATSLRVTGGQGGFAVGDVFRLGTATTPQYRVTAVAGDVITFTTFTGTGGPNGGLPTVLTGNPLVVTHFAAPLSGVGGRQIQVLVPGSSTKVEYGIVPTSDVTVEGSEVLTMSLLASNDYAISSPNVGLMTITDDDVVVWFDPTQNVNATEGGSNGSLTVRLSAAFPRNISLVYQVSGSATPGDGVTGDYTALSQLVTIPAGSVSGTITVVPTNDIVSEDPAETVVLTLQPTNDYRVVTSVGADANASAQITINDRVGVVAIVPTTTPGRESPTSSNNNATFTVSLSDDDGDLVVTSDDLIVTYSIAGTASAGSDYQTLSGSVVIPTGASSAVITVTPIDDLLPEAAETVIVTLTPAQGYSISSTNGAATVTLEDDEPVISVFATNATEGGASGVFTVSYLAPALSRDIVVDLSYSGTAAAGDYTATTIGGSPATQVTIPAGATSTTVTIAPVNDLTAEASETLIATVVAKPAVYTIGTSPATMTITDNEPVVSIQRVNDVAEGDSEQTFRVSYTAPSVGRNIAVKLAYPTDTATATAADFTTPLPSTVTIPSTGTEVFVTIPAKYDGVSEGTETLTCQIVANGTLYTIDTDTNSATCDVTDLVPTLSLSDDDTVTEGGTFDVKIISSFKPLVPFTVTYTVSGTATAGAAAGGTTDYQTLSGTIEISELETVIPVVTFADAPFDPNETVIITLNEVDPPTYLRSGAVPLSTTIQILDDKLGVLEVSSPDPDATYTEGDVLTIYVTFTVPVVITGKPTLRLETGTNDGVAKFQDLSLDGYDARFTYTVRATDVTANVDYTSVSALSLNGGTILSDDDAVIDLTLPAPGAEGSLAYDSNRPIAGGVDDGKPPPGSVTGSGGGCGLGSGFAALVALFMLVGLALSIRRPQA